MQLARFLRSSLNASDSVLVPLSRELDTLQSYLKVEQVRFEEWLNVGM